MYNGNGRRVRVPVTAHRSPRQEVLVPEGVTGREAEPACDELKEKLEEAQQEVVDYQDKVLRLQAEMVNYRRRMERLYEERAEEERRRLLRRFLTVADNLERALDHAEGGDGLRPGVELTHRELLRLLAQEGVEPMSPEGQPFDPEVHEAVAVVPADAEPNIVKQQVERGYTDKGRLLRPAKVHVSQ